VSVHQRKDGRWFVQYRDRETGRLKKESFGRGVDAERRARDRNRELGLRGWQRRTPPEMAPRFVDLAQAYINAKLGQMSKVSMDNLLWKMQGVILPALGHLRAIRITPAKMDRYVEKRLATPRTVRTGPPDASRRVPISDVDGQPVMVKRTTVHREISDVKAVLNWAVRRQYLPRNPIAGYEMPKRDDAVMLPPSTSEARRLIAVAPAHLARFLCLSYFTGLRPGRVELLSLTWSAVDWDAQTILILSAQKGGMKSRLVPLHEEFAPLLRSWFEADANPTGPIIHYRDKPVASLKTAFASAKKKAGITRRLRFYDFRHAFATTLLSSNADLKSTSELLGHTRTDTTTRIYQHTTRAVHRSAIAQLPALGIAADSIGHTNVPRKQKAKNPRHPGAKKR